MTIINPTIKPSDTPEPPEPTGVVIPKEEPTAPTPPAPTGDQPPVPPTGSGKTTFTAEDIEKARTEEKNKLYKSIEDMKGQLAAVTKEREEREAAAKKAAADEAAAAKVRQEDEMSAKQLLEQRNTEWEQRFTTMQAEQAKTAALLEQERKFASLIEYRTQRVTEMSSDIMPQLVDLVRGNTPEEIEQSIADMVARTQSIVGEAQAAMQQNRMAVPGTKITAPPTGPMDSQPGTETLTAEDIRNMDMGEYQKKRHLLMGAASQNRNKGLFG